MPEDYARKSRGTPFARGFEPRTLVLKCNAWLARCVARVIPVVRVVPFVRPTERGFGASSRLDPAQRAEGRAVAGLPLSKASQPSLAVGADVERDRCNDEHARDQIP